MCLNIFLAIIPGILAKEFSITEFVRHDIVENALGIISAIYQVLTALMQLGPRTATCLACYDLHPKVPKKQEISHCTPHGTSDSKSAHKNLIVAG